MNRETLPALLRYDSVAPLLSWTGAIEALRAGHRLARPELGDLLLGPGHALLLNRAAFIDGLGYAVKAETCVPGNAVRGLPSVQGAVLLYDPVKGSVRAIIEGRLVTAYKTAADSALAATLLARPDCRTLLIVGAGAVAETLARAYAAAFPTLERIAIWARRPEQAAVLAETLTDLPVPPIPVTGLAAAVKDADIISTATMACEPLICGEWVRPGSHVDLVGGFRPEMREADDALMARARIFVDHRATTIDRAGDLTQPIASGAITHENIRGDLYDMVASPPSLREHPEDITVFKNGGGAHLDLMIAEYIVRAAC